MDGGIIYLTQFMLKGSSVVDRSCTGKVFPVDYC